MTQEREVVHHLTETRSSRENELLQQRIHEIADIARVMNLDAYPIHFTVVPPHIMYEAGAYGLPSRFSHWTHGRAYHQMKTMYDYGLSKIYELVINTNPSHAFLLENNGVIQNTLVVAHVFAHVDFFKNNLAFRHTDRKMADTATLHAERIRQYELQHGKLEVEKFLDDVLAIQLNFDPVDLDRHSPQDYIAHAQKLFQQKKGDKSRKKDEYDDLFVKKAETNGTKNGKTPIPFEEEQDLLYIINSFSRRPLEPWQQDIVDIVRNESHYFLPQMKTKIMNEGWATFWHKRILEEMGNRDLLEHGEMITWSVMHANIASPSRGLNPYYVGWKIWEDIQRLYEGRPHDKGKVSKNWLGKTTTPESCKGSKKYDVLWVRECVTSDTELISNYLTDYLIEDLDLYTYAVDKAKNAWVITEKDPEKVRQNLINQRTNFGLPVIKVAPGGIDYEGNGGLYLLHKWDGIDLDMPWAEKTLACIQRLWGRAVHLETQTDNQKILITCKIDGTISKKN